MSSNTRIWLLGSALLVAGIVMVVMGSRIDVAEVTVALASVGAALTASGITTVLVKLAWEDGGRPARR